MTTQLRFEPLTGTIGAVVHGLDINAGPSDAEVEAAHRGLMDYHVLFFRDQHPSPEALLAFARRFGPISPRHPLHLCVPGLEEVMVIVDDATKPPENDIWHSDLSGQPKPPFAGVLHGVELPAAGGDTMWCDMHAVYEALSPHMRDFLGGLTALHDVAASFQGLRDRFDDRGAAIDGMSAEAYTARHPVVVHHPGNGRPLVYVNRTFTTRIEELTEAESAAVLETLYTMIETPRFHVRFRWTEGAVAMWDNWATQHYAIGDHFPARRVMQRVTVADDARVESDATWPLAATALAS